MFNLNVPRSLRNGMSDDKFRVYCNADAEGPVELLVMDEIGESWYGEGVKATDVVSFLSSNRGRDVNVRINSPGGLVYDGLVIYNNLKQHDGIVTVTIEGLAFSAASFIAMAGDTIRMHEASDIGIHRAWGGGVGNAKTMRGVAEWLDQIDSHLVEIYQAKTGAGENQINEWLDGTDDGTLFSAKEAVRFGFADELIPIKEAGKTDSKSMESISNRRRCEIASMMRELQQNRYIKNHS